ncbi:conserved hypothetical protein [Ricinus communis]|uniref:Uncharacterized protein n=1 Tax=Ricinus communis TaxID=3988 RepID=B9T604_RICCO|nr:conserved hypothetical protein [Ricinus communis]
MALGKIEESRWDLCEVRVEIDIDGTGSTLVSGTGDALGNYASEGYRADYVLGFKSGLLDYWVWDKKERRFWQITQEKKKEKKKDGWILKRVYREKAGKRVNPSNWQLAKRDCK